MKKIMFTKLLVTVLCLFVFSNAWAKKYWCSLNVWSGREPVYSGLMVAASGVIGGGGADSARIDKRTFIEPSGWISGIDDEEMAGDISVDKVEYDRKNKVIWRTNLLSVKEINGSDFVCQKVENYYTCIICAVKQ